LSGFLIGPDVGKELHPEFHYSRSGTVGKVDRRSTLNLGFPRVVELALSLERRACHRLAYVAGSTCGRK
jgi:hypothetical protein